MAVDVMILTNEDRELWREACARMEVAQSGNASLDPETAVAWVRGYYAMTDRLYSEYGITGDEMDRVTIFPASGRVVIEDD